MDRLQRRWFGVDEPGLHEALEKEELSTVEYIVLAAAALRRAREGIVLGELPDEHSTPAFQLPNGITRRSRFVPPPAEERGIQNAQ